MRNYIFTDKERKTLETFIASGTKLNGFSILLLRLKKAKPRLGKDLELLEKVMEKIEAEIS